MMRLLASLALAAVVGLSDGAGVANARSAPDDVPVRPMRCTCSPSMGPPTKIGERGAVFRGVVVARRDTILNGRHWRIITLHTGSSWNRNVTADSVVELVTGGGGGDCGYGFLLHQEYLVYAGASDFLRPLTTSICTRTRPISAAAEDLASIGPPAFPSRLGRDSVPE